MHSTRVIKHAVLVRIAIAAVCSALYFVLCSYATIKIPNINLFITFAPLVLIVVAALYGPLDATAVAFIGAFLDQAVGPYGLTPTTLLWCVPHMARGLLIGIFALIMFRKKAYCEDKKALFIIVCSVVALIVTVLNTGAIALDAIIFDYYTHSLVFASLAARLVLGVVTSAVLSVVAYPVIKALRAAGFGRVMPEEQNNTEQTDSTERDNTES
ncbi:MAG: ECF transporter S component [Clostridia bacterium]|nr:ECF transporter S component [Clostridia bacterium]